MIHPDLLETSCTFYTVTFDLKFRQRLCLRREDMIQEDGRKKNQPRLAALKGQTPVKIITRRGGRTSVTLDHIRPSF